MHRDAIIVRLSEPRAGGSVAIISTPLPQARFIVTFCYMLCGREKTMSAKLARLSRSAAARRGQAPARSRTIRWRVRISPRWMHGTARRASLARRRTEARAPRADLRTLKPGKTIVVSEDDGERERCGKRRRPVKTGRPGT